MRRHLPILTPGLLHHPTPFGLLASEIYSVIRSTPMVILPDYYSVRGVPNLPDLPVYLTSVIEKYYPIPNINKGMENYYTPAYKLMKSIYYKGNTPLIRLK